MIFNVGDSQKILEKARKLYVEGKIERAIKTLERSLSGNKEDFPLCLELGKYFFERNKFVESATNFKKAYHFFPEKWEEIIDAIESEHFASGTPVETGILLLEIYVDKGMFEEARKIVDGSSEEQIEEMTKRYETIYNNIISKKKLEEYTRKDILHMYSLSFLQQKKDLKKGLILYEKIFLSFPDERNKILADLGKICQVNYSAPYPRFLTGKLLLKAKKFTEGLKHFERAIELDKNYIGETIKIVEEISTEEKIPILISYLAKYQIIQGNLGKAVALAKEMENMKDVKLRDIIRLYSEIIRKDKTNSDVRLSLTKLYAKEEKYEPVLSELTNIIELNPEKYKEVTSIAEDIIKKDPYNTNLLYFLSDLYIEREKTAQAISTLEKLFKADKELSIEIIEKLNKVLEKDLENVKGLNLLAQVYCYKKKFDEALLIYEHLMDLKDGSELAESGIKKITEERPELLKAKISLWLLAFKRGKHKESLDIIDSVLKKDPGKVAKLIPQLDHIARMSVQLAPYVLEVYKKIPTETIDPFILNLAKAEAFILCNDYKNGVLFYTKCFEINPEAVDKILNGIQRILQKQDNLAFAHFALGKIYLKIENITEALNHLTKANELDPNFSDQVISIIYEFFKRYPNDPSVTNSFLTILLTKGAYEQVIVECENAINRFPKEKTGPIYLKHGQASLEKGLLKQAALSIVHALDIDESFSSEALKLLKAAIAIDKNNVVVKYGLAKACIAAKEYSEAAYQFYDITKTDPTKIAKAIEELKKIVNIDSVNPDVHFVLGSLYLTKKKVKDAIAEFKTTSELSGAYIDKVIGKLQYIEKHNPLPEVYLNLGELYIKKRMFSKAAHYLTDAYRKDTNLIEQSSSYLNRIKDEDPQNIVVLYALAEMAEKENDLKRTIEIYEHILQMIPEETAKIRQKVESLLERNESEIEVSMFYSKLLYLDGKAEKSIKILKQIASEHPDELPTVIERLREMSEQGEEEASFSLSEYLLENNSYNEAISLLEKISLNFSLQNRIIDLLKNYIVSGVSYPGLILYLANFLYLRDDWITLKEVISRGLSTMEEELLEPLLILKFLLNEKEGKETLDIKKQIIKKIGKKKFRSSLLKLEEEKREFYLKRVRSAREKSPEVPSLRFEEAELLNELGKTEEAIKLLAKPFKSKEDNVMAKYLTAKSFFLSNNPIRTIEILRSAQLPQKKELKNKLLLLLSMAYEKIGDYKSALITLKNSEPDVDIEKRIIYLNEMAVMSDTKGGIPIISG